MKQSVIIFWFLLLFTPLIGQESMTLQLEEGQSSPTATIEEVAWIAGYWHGEAFGGLTEEVWTKPSGGSMMGSFKSYTEDKVSFYELCVIREIDDTLILQLKHFNDDLKAWEEKDVTVDFPLVKLEENRVYFSGFTFERLSDKKMNIYVVIGDKHEEIKFEFSAKEESF